MFWSCWYVCLFVCPQADILTRQRKHLSPTFDQTIKFWYDSDYDPNPGSGPRCFHPLTDCHVFIIFLLILSHRWSTMGVIMIALRPLPPFIVIFNFLPTLKITFNFTKTRQRGANFLGDSASCMLVDQTPESRAPLSYV